MHWIGHGDLDANTAGKHLDATGLAQLLVMHANQHSSSPAVNLVFLNLERGVLLSTFGSVVSVIAVHGLLADAGVAVPFAKVIYDGLSGRLARHKPNSASLWIDKIKGSYRQAMMETVAQPSALPLLLSVPPEALTATADKKDRAESGDTTGCSDPIVVSNGAGDVILDKSTGGPAPPISSDSTSQR